MKNTKEKILQKALDLFVIKGYSGSSIRDIAKEVGIRESGIYNHFSSKQAILEAIIEKLSSGPVAKVILTDDLLDKITEPEIFIRDFARKIFEFWQTENERALIKLILSEQFHSIGEVEISLNSYLEEYLNITKMIFTELIKHKLFKKGNAGIFAESFIGFLFLLRLKYLDFPSNKEVLKKIDEHSKIFWESVKK